MRVLILIVAVLLSSFVCAEEIKIPIGEQGISGLNMPTKGQTMDTVISIHGEPGVRHPAKGNPAITRWEFSNFVVYFEGNHVIHSVPRHKPRAEHQKPTNH